jgi:steroid delta-isomerase-like uncharacterized protein
MSSTATTTQEELVRRDIETWNDHDIAAVDDLYAADARYRDPMGEVHDRTSYKEYIRMVLTAFPDFHVDIRGLAETDDGVYCRYTFSGTMEGEFRGFEPTGESFELHGIAWSRIEDGVIVESWNATNTMAMAQQLGLLG